MITAAGPYHLQSAVESDFDFLYHVACTAMHDYVDAIWGWDEEFQRNQFRDNFRLGEWQLIVIDGRRVGGVGTRLSPNEIFLANIYLLPEYRGRGVGSSIIGRLQRLGIETGRPVLLNVLTSNTDAYRLYLRLGFHVVQSTDEKRLMST